MDRTFLIVSQCSQFSWFQVYGVHHLHSQIFSAILYDPTDGRGGMIPNSRSLATDENQNVEARGLWDN